MEGFLVFYLEVILEKTSSVLVWIEVDAAEAVVVEVAEGAKAAEAAAIVVNTTMDLTSRIHTGFSARTNGTSCHIR